MAKPKSDLLQSTLDMLILKTLALEPMRGWGVSQRLRSRARAGDAGDGQLVGVHDGPAVPRSQPAFGGTRASRAGRALGGDGFDLPAQSARPGRRGIQRQLSNRGPPAESERTHAASGLPRRQRGLLPDDPAAAGPRALVYGSRRRASPAGGGHQSTYGAPSLGR